jgi:aquaporin related protein
MNITEPTGFRLPGTKIKGPLDNDNQRDGHAKQYMRVPGLGFLPNKFRNHFIAMVGEFIGTFLFLFFAFSATQVANAAALGVGNTTSDGSLSQAPNAQSLMYIALAFGFSLAVNAWVFFRISGGA